jgi:hypothetical protein
LWCQHPRASVVVACFTAVGDLTEVFNAESETPVPSLS